MSKALKYIGSALATLVVIGTSVLAQAANRFDLLLNPIAAPIKLNVGPWGEMIDLTPKPFSIGASQSNIIKSIKRAGFSRTPDDEVWALYSNEISDGYALYQREGNNLVCAIEFYVFVKFDDFGFLVSAKGTEHEHGCL